MHGANHVSTISTDNLSSSETPITSICAHNDGASNGTHIKPNDCLMVGHRLCLTWKLGRSISHAMSGLMLPCWAHWNRPSMGFHLPLCALRLEQFEAF